MAAPSHPTTAPVGGSADNGYYIERFLRAFYARRPVDATFIGIEGYDHQLPDISEAGVAETIRQMQWLLSEAPPAPAVSASWAQRTDHRLALGCLRIQLWEHESRWLLKNPSFVVSEATFGMMSLLQHLHTAESRPARIAALRHRMLAVPEYLQQAVAHLGAETPAAWAEKAIRECGAALAFLTEGVTYVPEDLSAEAAVAAAAFAQHKQLLERMLRTADFCEFAGCGGAAFGLYMHEGHCLSMDADEILSYAMAQMANARRGCDNMMAEAGLDGVADEVMSHIAALHPTVDEYLPKFEAVWDEMKTLAESNNLLTWPQRFPIQYSMYETWSRSSVGELYFLHYRTPKTYGAPLVHTYMVTPIDAAMDDYSINRVLTTNNDYAIKTNHVLHHGGIGHHVQNFHAPKSPSALGRIAHIDVSSRIALFCAGTLTEGWACYSADLAAEFGALTPLELLAHKKGHLRMCARAIVDVELHRNNMTLAEAADFYTKQAGMTAASAAGEALKNSMFPGAAMMCE